MSAQSSTTFFTGSERGAEQVCFHGKMEETIYSVPFCWSENTSSSILCHMYSAPEYVHPPLNVTMILSLKLVNCRRTVVTAFLMSSPSNPTHQPSAVCHRRKDDWLLCKAIQYLLQSRLIRSLAKFRTTNNIFAHIMVTKRQEKR